MASSLVTDQISQSEWTSKRMVWVPSEDSGFIAASIVEEKGDKTVVSVDGGKQITVNTDEIQKMNPPKFDRVSDMAELTCLNEASVLHNLSQRYFSDQIYTYSGLFCVVINPYKTLKIYSDQYVQSYKAKKRHEIEPHVFAVADGAYRSMSQDRENQSILCTGESGAGKTENTKKIIQFLVSLASRPPSAQKIREAVEEISLEDQLLQANPLMESFGNAKTLKNDNSSRFSKFIRINFDNQGYISGTAVETSILENGRVPRQQSAERGFHIFYQMLKGATPEMKESFLLGKPSDYRFLMNKDSIVATMDDVEEFNHTLKCMKIIGFLKEDIDTVLKLTSAVLLFGNMEFAQDKSEQASMPNSEVAQKLCRLLTVNVTDFTKALLKPRVKAGRELVTRSQNKAQVEYSSEALAKALYERVFKFVIQKINKSLDRDKKISSSFIGILDVAGFEIFDVNSFEQLCINYTNEKLQQLFNHTMFVREQQEYTNEGIKWEFIDFGLDLQPCIDLLEKSPGIFALLDEECLLPKSTEKSLAEKLVGTLGDNRKFEKPSFKSTAHMIILHYAGRVEYTLTNWLVKNNDALNENVTQLFAQSSDPYMKSLWKDFDQIPGSESGVISRTRKGMFRTVGQLYKEQLGNLMKTLGDTQPNFVRCIIPNLDKKAGRINASLVLDQLRCNGVLEGIRICRQGFPNRIVFNEFRTRYEILTQNVIPKGFMDGKKAAELMLKKLELDPGNYRIGQSKIFFRAGVLATLEEDRDKILTEFVIQFQAVIRGKISRRYFSSRNNLKASVDVIQRNIRRYFELRQWIWWRLYTKVKPFLAVTRQEDSLREKDEVLKKTTERLSKVEIDLKDTESRCQSLSEERRALTEQIQIAQDGLAELEDKNSKLLNRASQLDVIVTDLEAQIQEEENKVVKQKGELSTLNAELVELKESLASSQIENQKLSSDRSEMEGKIKRLEEEVVSLQDQISRLTKEKKSVDDKLSETLSKLQVEEDRIKNLMKSKGKQESSITEMSDQLSSLEKAKSDLEREKKGLDLQLNQAKLELTEMTTKSGDLTAQVSKREQEIMKLNSRLEEETGKKSLMDRSLRDLNMKYEELTEEHEVEKKARARAEKQANELSAELEGMRNELDVSMDTTAMQKEVQNQREQEVSKLKAKIQEEVDRHEVSIAEMKTRQNQLVQELNDQLDQLKKSKSTAEKAKAHLESEKTELDDQLKRINISKSDCDKKIRILESAQNELRSQLESANSQVEKLTYDMSASKRECDTLTITVDDLEKKISLLESSGNNAQSSLDDAQEQLQREIDLKNSLQNRFNDLNKQFQSAQEHVEEEEEKRNSISKQLSDVQKNYDNATRELESTKISLEELEGAKRKFSRDLEETQQKLQQVTSENSKLEKSRNKFRQDLEDMNHSLEQSRQNVSALEKKQKKFDQMLNEEKANSDRNSKEKEVAEAACRQAEAKVLQLSQQFEDAKSQIEDLERAKRNLQNEMDSLSEGKDDAGKRSLETEKECLRLRSQCSELQDQLNDLDAELETAEDVKNRLKVQMDSALSQMQRDMEAKDCAMDDERRSLQKQIADLRAIEEDDRKNKSSLHASKKKTEGELKVIQSQMEEVVRSRDESSKQLKRYTTQIRELSQEMDEVRASKEELINLAKDNERKLRFAESELQSIQSQVSTLDRQKRTLESERDSMSLELESKLKCTVSLEEKKRLDSKISEVQDELDESQEEATRLKTKLKQQSDRCDQISMELRQSRETTDSLQMSNINLEKQIKSSRDKNDELERYLKQKKSQLTDAESRESRLREELQKESEDCNSAKKAKSKAEKAFNAANLANETLKGDNERMKQYADGAISKHRQVVKICQSKDIELEQLRQELNSLRNSHLQDSQIPDLEMNRSSNYSSTVNFMSNLSDSDDDGKAK